MERAQEIKLLRINKRTSWDELQLTGITLLTGTLKKKKIETKIKTNLNVISRQYRYLIII